MTPRTKLIVLSNRHNPSGSALSDETLLALAEEAQRVSPRVRILVDETYSLLGSHRPAALLGRCFLSVGSLSKVYGLGLLRCGWLVGSPDVMNPVRTAWLHTMNIGSKLTEALAALALDHLDEYAGRWREVVSVNRGVVREALEGLGDLVQGDVPPDSCVCFPRIHVPDVDRFVERLESGGKVVVAPGRFFRAPGHVRIGFGGDTAKLKQGMDRLAKSLRQEASRTEYGC
jgi:aspartate/methionine/tyrosine aminotransferase